MRRLVTAALGLVVVIAIGTVGYMMLGLGFIAALYQTVFTVATVGYTELYERSTAAEIFTIVLIVLGVGTVLYNLGVLAEALTEGHLREYLRRRRMDAVIATKRGHVVVVGFGRTGREAVSQLVAAGHDVVAIDSNPARLAHASVAHLVGDGTRDEILQEAGIAHARAVIVALDTDAATVYATLSARALNPQVVIISRAHAVESKAKIVLAGATRAVNPQLIGGRRMASFALHADVAEFLDGVMHSDEVDHEFEQVRIHAASPFAGKRLADIDLFRELAVPVLAVRFPDKGAFLTNPPRSTRLDAGCTLILLASSDQVAAVHAAAHTSD